MCIAVLHRIPTGCRAIDKILEGGIQSEHIALIYGEPETAKTTLAMQCAVSCAMQGHKTLVIDCDGTFSAKRLSQVASQSFEKIAESIILMKPNDFRDQAVVIDRLTDYINKGFALVIVDTINSLYRAKVSESPAKAFELNRELNRQLASLAQIARTQKVAIVIVSQVRTMFKEEYVSIEPVATRVVKFWADTIINMRPTEDPRIIKAILEKTPTKPQPVTCYLRIEESGIHEYSFH